MEEKYEIIKFYACNENGQIRKILARNYEEAVEIAKEKFRSDNIRVGKLPRIHSKEKEKEIEEETRRLLHKFLLGE